MSIVSGDGGGGPRGLVFQNYWLYRYIYIPLMLIGTPIRERSQSESLVESIPGPQLATGGMTRDSSNMMSVRQLVAF